MFLRKYYLFIVIVFLGIFTAKMVISGAPLFFTTTDSESLNAVIMQVELEHGHGQDSGKDITKCADLKLYGFNSMNPFCDFVVFNITIKNSFIEHYKRYVDPHHPSVPTPPPNLV